MFWVRSIGRFSGYGLMKNTRLFSPCRGAQNAVSRFVHDCAECAFAVKFSQLPTNACSGPKCGLSSAYCLLCRRRNRLDWTGDLMCQKCQVDRATQNSLNSHEMRLAMQSATTTSLTQLETIGAKFPVMRPCTSGLRGEPFLSFDRSVVVPILALQHSNYRSQLDLQAF